MRNPAEGTRVKSRGNEFWPFGNEFWHFGNEFLAFGNEFLLLGNEFWLFWNEFWHLRTEFWPYWIDFNQYFAFHSPIFAKFIRSKMRTWKSLIVQASPWYVDPCSCGLDLQELQKNFCPWTKGGTSVKSFFHCGPPFDSKVENFCSSWRSRPLEHESTHHMEA